jgi:hypothetical protein
MMPKASTTAEGQATAVAPRIRSLDHRMIRIFLIVVVAGLVLLGVGVLMLGAFPPNPHPQTVEKVLPNDKFQSH